MSASAGPYTLRFQSGSNVDAQLVVTTPIVNERATFCIALTKRRREECVVYYGYENIDGAAAFIAGQSPQRRKVTLYRTSHPDEIVARWELMRATYAGRQWVDPSAVKSILVSMQKKTSALKSEREGPESANLDRSLLQRAFRI